MKQVFKLIKTFIWEHKATYLVWLLLLGTQALTLYLYDQTQAILGDTLLFSCLIIFSYTLVAFSRWQRKLKQLQLLQTNFSHELLPLSTSQAEMLYQQIAEELEQKLVAELEHSRLKKQEMLEDFGIWLHQVKTPVSALDLLIQAQGNDPKMRAELFKVNEYLQLMLNYLRQQLDNSDLVFEQVALDQVIKEVLKKYALFFAQKGLRVEFVDLDAKVTTDKKWLIFILEQLIFNAIKYTNTGTITFIFNGDHLAIKDTGIGIKAQDIPRVFDKGFTGYNGRQDQRASGLGLYLSQKVATKLGCQLELTSKVGQGTTVKVYFPKYDK
ncbi:sensor histidine kinase [Ligilactobacillus murinus]|uniref:sensor histidine kinase n=1 Tax=Ligilactobacillus murinus TaxID=1622 RepID=UPI00296B546C|nr:sensor histidine kinase [Ligilactobacillus murinus]WOY88366.1 sensor histidine kinase [Ligilactobacillus murinus]